MGKSIRKACESQCHYLGKTNLNQRGKILKAMKFVVTSYRERKGEAEDTMRSIIWRSMYQILLQNH